MTVSFELNDGVIPCLLIYFLQDSVFVVFILARFCPSSLETEMSWQQAVVSRDWAAEAA